jgi:hypothetical protein
LIAFCAYAGSPLDLSSLSMISISFSLKWRNDKTFLSIQYTFKLA